MKHILITAHSGCEGTPDNSMESIYKGIELGADCIEIDIRMDPEGKLRLTHNEPECWDDLIELETALPVILNGGTAVNCDLKEEKLLYPVLEALESAGFPREKMVFSGSVNVALLKADPTIVQRARIFLNLEQLLSHIITEIPQAKEEAAVCFDEHIEEIAALVKALGVECINPSFRIMPHERIEAALAHGIQLSLWTANEPEDQAALLQEDLINMTTRQVESALRLRKEIRGY